MTSTAIPKVLNIPSVADGALVDVRARSRAVGALVMSGFAAACQSSVSHFRLAA